MPDFPAHASPAFPPISSPRPKHGDRTVSELNLDRNSKHDDHSSHPPLISPAFTPPHTPFHDDKRQHTLPVEELERRPSNHLPELPIVHCEVRARIPTTTGQEMFLHLYHNNVDAKEHLAIVFGPHIRSKSLDAPRPGETERDRMIRGAYVGTLYPGRTSSRRVQEIQKEAGARPSAGYLSGLNGPIQHQPAPSESDDGSEFDSIYPPSLGPPLVRIHSECYTGETVWSARCDCGEQLDEAARLMSLPIPTPVSTPGSEASDEHQLQHQLQANGKLPSCGGVIIYLRQEGRGIGLGEKLKAYNLQDLGHDTMEANLLLRHPGDARSYGLATAMLLDLGLGNPNPTPENPGLGIRLLTNNPEKVRAVEGRNREVRVVERVAMIPLAWQTGGKEGVQGKELDKYLGTKIEKFKHMFAPG
ncbi:GTP cyclohydrolase II [Elasticomyces elasticus]|uniref:GTP cyclohydrolase II n=1 Tax=Elasticomyces elasticus TaxID=574655 RepID=A0AAN7W199_9PEZI|nr:GTP cyclohydrolase II [Elasticomyces elasticus]